MIGWAQAHLALAISREELREIAGGVAAVGFVGGKKDLQVGIVAAQIGDEFAIAQDDAGADAAGERAVGLVGIVGVFGDRGPAQDRPVGIRWICSSHGYKFRALGLGVVAQRAQQVDCGGQGELRGA